MGKEREQMKTVTSFFVYANLAIGLVVSISAIFLLVPLDWLMYFPIILLLGFIILAKKRRPKKNPKDQI